jgi:hypothetical protein
MLSRQEEEAERRRVFAQDQSLRTGTYMSHTHDDIHQGRFAAIGTAQVVGQSPVPQYPAASAAHQIQLPDEPPLGFDNPALDHPGPDGDTGPDTGPTSDVRHGVGPLSHNVSNLSNLSILYFLSFL